MGIYVLSTLLMFGSSLIMNEFFSFRKKTGRIRLKTYLDYPCGMLSLIDDYAKDDGEELSTMMHCAL